MIDIKDKHTCCGCGACVQRCPKLCISLQEDNEGFLYPVADKETCIECGLCEKVCPVINQYDKRIPLHAYAAINTNEEIRMQSSSGGIFSLLAERILDKGGVVFGARFDDQWQVTLDYTETKEGLTAFRGSKYVQARTSDTYKKCENFLKAGRKVMYSGTPCQIAGLNRFLRKEYDNLLTVDFVCHGTPSPKVWRRYLSEITSPEAVKQIAMRSKKIGWKNFSFAVEYDEENASLSFSSTAHQNAYMKAFLSDLILRPSCHQCAAKECRTNSDITIADFWGIWDVKPELNDDKGTSLVLVHNHKAKHFLSTRDVMFCKVPYEEAAKYNSALFRSSKQHPKREVFFNKLDKSTDVSRLVRKLTLPSGLAGVKAVIKMILKNRGGHG